MKQISKRLSFLPAAFIAVVLMTGTGCIKKRADKEVQGANLNELVEVSTVNSWSHAITAGDDDTKGDTSLSRQIEVEKGIENLYFPRVVKYQTDSPLLKGHIERLNLYGFKNRSYKIIYKFVPGLLKLYKVIPAEDLSHYEQPYVESNAEGEAMVPLGGFSVSYYDVKKIEDADGRKTNLSQKFPVSSEKFQTATHVKIDYTNFKEFEFVRKTDLYPVDYFVSSEWYFSAAEISKKPDQQDGIGYVDGVADVSGKKASLINFTRTDSLLRATNAVRDDRVELTEDQADLVFSIPAIWKKFRVKEEGGFRTLQEENMSREVYSNKEWGSLNLAGIAIQGIGSASVEDSIKGIVLDKIKFKNNSFSFTLLYVKNGNKVKFSFLRKEKRDDYVEKIYFKKDRTVFGAFSINKYRTANLDEVRTEDIESNVLVQRFNPKKDIVFRFSDITPPAGFKDVGIGAKFDFREIGRSCVKYWDRAFKLAGSDINIILDESRDAELGDFDSNILNIIPVYSNAGGGGVAPSVSDPVTGEVIASTTNVFVTNGRIKMVVNAIRNYIRIHGGVIEGVKLLDAKGDGLPILNHISKEVRTFCPEVISFAAKVKAEGLTVQTAEENLVVIPCAEKLVKTRMQSVLCHEMGHNFGLRHNFFCSADEKNIVRTKKAMETLYPEADFPGIYEMYPKEELYPEMSCVMDYTGVEEHNRPGMPMLYDIAGIAYIYSEKVFNKIDLEGGVLALKSISTESPLVEQESFNEGAKLKFCTDENSVYRASQAGKAAWDPMCDLWDNGTTPSAKIQHLSRRMREALVLYGRRYDRAGSASASALANDVGRSLNEMSQIYGTWRAYLAGTLESNNFYLNKFTETEYLAHIDKLKTQEDFIGSDYIGVAETFYDVLTSVFELSDYYCVSRDEAGQTRLLKFTELQDEIISSGTTFVVNGCDDDLVAEHLKEGRKWEYMFEYGIPSSESVKFSQDPKDDSEPVDIVSIGGAKTMARMFLTTRISPSTYPMARKKILPALLDEPHLYKAFMTEMDASIFEGVKYDKSLMTRLQEQKSDVALNGRMDNFGNMGVDYSNLLDSLMNYNQSTRSIPQSLILLKNGGALAKGDMILFVLKRHNSLRLVDETKPYYAYKGIFYQPERTDGFAAKLIARIEAAEIKIAELEAGSGVLVDRDAYLQKYNQLSGFRQIMEKLPAATF